MEWPVIDDHLASEVIGELADHGVDRDRLVATTQVDNFITQRFETGQGAAGDVVDVGEVPGLGAIAVEGDWLAAADPLAEAERGHVGTPGRTIDGEVAEHRDIDPVKVVPDVGETLGGEFGSGVGGDGAGYDRVLGERHRLPGVERGGGSNYKLGHLMPDHAFEQIEGAHRVGAHVQVRGENARPDAGPGSEIDHGVEAMLGEDPVQRRAVFDIGLVKRESG